jgi:hypothetical protein
VSPYDADPTKLQIWWDAACTQPVAAEIVIGEPVPAVMLPAGWNETFLYLTSTANTWVMYTITATPQTPMAISDRQTWHFVDPASPGPRALQVNLPRGVMPPGQIVTLAGAPDLGDAGPGAKTTPLTVQVLTADDGLPLSNSPISATLMLWGHKIARIQPLGQVTDDQGYVTLSVFPVYTFQTFVRLYIWDELSRGQGYLPVTTRCLSDVQISADPPLVKQPGTVTFTVHMQDVAYGGDPSGIKLLWAAGDTASQKYFQGSTPVTTDHRNPVTFQYSAGPITQADLNQNPLGHIKADLRIYGSESPFHVPYTVYFEAANPPGRLKAPYCDVPPYQNTASAIISDDILTEYGNTGVPIAILPLSSPPSDGSGKIFLWAHVKAGPLLGDAGQDVLLATIALPPSIFGQKIDYPVPVSHDIFQHNWIVNVYYSTNFGEFTISDDVCLIVDRTSLKQPPPDTDLLMPLPDFKTYDYGRWVNKIPFNSKVLFNPASHIGIPQNGDTVCLRLHILGSVPDNVNQEKTLEISHTIGPKDQINSSMSVRFDGTPGHAPNFPSTDFDGMDLSEGELYFLYRAVGSSTWLRSPSTRVRIDTVANISSKSR